MVHTGTNLDSLCKFGLLQGWYEERIRTDTALPVVIVATCPNTTLARCHHRVVASTGYRRDSLCEVDLCGLRAKVKEHSGIEEQQIIWVSLIVIAVVESWMTQSSLSCVAYLIDQRILSACHIQVVINL